MQPNQPYMYVNTEPFLDDISPAPPADTPSELPGETLDPEATDDPLAPSSMVPTTQSCSTSVRGPCTVVLSTTTTTIDVGIQCESLAPAISVVSPAEVLPMCLPQLLRFPLTCPPQVPPSCSPDSTSRSPPVFSQPPQEPISCSPKTPTRHPPLVFSHAPQTSPSGPPVHQKQPVVHHWYSVVHARLRHTCPLNVPIDWLPSSWRTMIYS